VKPYLLLLATIVALSISYYFVVALPANNRARLDFEKEKYRNEQAELQAKKLAEAEERNRNSAWLSSCLASADKTHDRELALNGTKHGDSYSVDSRIVAVIAKRRLDAIAECHKQFGP